jgi:2-(1,2-epoxy-1,2-dihydrophenyl)acetyl-CoA isomerase
MLTFDLRDGVATLTLVRPDVLNALDGALIAELLATLERVKSDDQARALLLTGRGRGFCAGADLRDDTMNLEQPPAERGRRFRESADAGMHALIRALAGLGKPTVCAVNGVAAGGGASLALTAHLVIAGESAYFQQPFTSQLGLVPDMGGSWHLMRKLGPARALPLVMLGERLPARQAAEWGLVWKCVPDAELQATARETAERLARGAPRALAMLPELMHGALHRSLDEQLDRERDGQAALVQTDDFVEAVRAFRDKRKPTFRGR